MKQNVIGSYRAGPGKDFEDVIVETEITGDADGRFYMRFKEQQIGIDLPDILHLLIAIVRET